MNLLGVLLSVSTILGPTAEECLVLETAYNALQRSSFSAERHFTLKLNGELKMREIARLTYTAGTLTKTLLKEEIFDDGLVLEEGDGEAMLDLSFDCARVDIVDDGNVQFHNADKTEKVVFAWDSTKGTLRPVLWEISETHRFQRKKFVIESMAEYKKFKWE